MNPRPDSIPALTGLRFVAAFAVFVEHAREIFHLPIPGYSMVGGLAVAFFFVLSGFILGYVYRGRMQRKDIGRFWLSRWARIWPLHIATLVLYSLAHRNPVLPADAAEWGMLATNVALVQTWSTSLDQVLSFNGVSWSISVELFFYALFPLSTLLSNRGFAAFYGLLLVAIGTAVSLAAHYNDPPRSLETPLLVFVKFGPPMRLVEFATGIAVARLLSAGFATRLAATRATVHTGFELLAIAGIALWWTLLGPSNWIYSFLDLNDYPVLAYYLNAGPGFVPPFALLVFTMAWSRGFLSRFLATRPMVFLGEASFALYLVHRTVMLAIDRTARGLGFDWPLLVALSLAGTLAASALLFLLVETPCRRWILALASRAPKATRDPKASRTETAAGVPAADPQPKALPARPVRSMSRLRLLTVGIAMAVLFVSFATVGEVAEARAFDRARTAAGSIDDALRGAVFADEGTLIGMSTRLTETTLDLDFVWQKAPNASRNLFVHLCDARGEVLRQAPHGSLQVSDPELGLLGTAFVTIPFSDLRDVESIGIGFYSRDKQAALVDRGPRSMALHRLDVMFRPAGMALPSADQGR